VVTKVEKLYSGDTTIWFARDQEDSWSYELEHVDKPAVKVGDKVTAGQAVAEVSAYTARHHPGYGLVELGLFHPLGRKPTHWCPFARFDPSVKDDYNKKITQLYSAWEDYVGDSTIYNQEAYPTPGCATLEHANG
jgi:hypothetical protein